MSEKLIWLPCPADYPPCPLCGHQPEMMGSRHVACCNIVCDDSDTWFNLPRAMTWTTEPPKEPGHYYAECYDRTQTLFKCVVEIVELREALFAFFPGNEVEWPLSDFLRWCYIPMPQEPPHANP